MKAALHAFGVVKAQGRLQLVPKDLLAYRDLVATLGEGECLEMTLGQPEDSYTYRQLRYIHAEPVKKLCAAEGYTPAQAKIVLLGEHFGWTWLANGHEVPERSSLTELTRAEMRAFIDWCPQFGAEHNINILPPESDLAKRETRLRHVEDPTEAA